MGTGGTVRGEQMQGQSIIRDLSNSVIKIATAQYPISKHTSLDSWRAHTKKWVGAAADQGAEILLFPEYGSMELLSFFDEEVHKSLPLQIQKLQTLLDDFIETYRQLAADQGVLIVAPSIAVADARFGLPVNRCFLFFPDGKVEYQDKRHMTRFEDEIWKIGPGEAEQKTFEFRGVKFGITICFDVEFPFAAHELANQGVQILLAPSCTESLKGLNRVHVGAKARALENQFYVLVSQTVGEAPWSEAVDKNTGIAAVYSTCDVGFPDDGTIAKGDLNKPDWVIAELDLNLLETVRSQGQVFNLKHMQMYSKQTGPSACW